MSLGIPFRDKNKTILEIYSKNAKLYHDLRNHLNVLYYLLEEQKVNEAKEYIKRIGQPAVELSKKTWTGVDAVDAVINSKMQIIKERSIQANINVEFPINTNIQLNDICTILGNLLDNAIEAIEKLNNHGKITLIIRKIHEFLLIKVTNTYRNNKKKYVEELETTKKDKELHGWGLLSVKSAVENYNGTIKHFNCDDEFTVMIMLFYEKTNLSSN